MSTEYEKFINEYHECLNKLSDSNQLYNQLHIIFDLIFSKNVLIEERKIENEHGHGHENENENDEELSKYKFEDYLKEVFDQLEKSSPLDFEFCCKCLLGILLNQEITPELKQRFYQHIISWFSFMQKKVIEETKKDNNSINQIEILSAMMDIYESGIIDLWAPTRLACGKFLTLIIYKYINLMNNHDFNPSSIMDKLLRILNNHTLQWQKYEGAVIGIYNLLLIQEFTDTLMNNDIHLLIGILFTRIISSQQSIRDWCVRVISIIFSKKGNSDELKNLLMETLKHLQPVNWTNISNDAELYSPCTPKTPVDNYYQYNEFIKLPLLLNGSIDFTNYPCTLNCIPSHFDENVNLNQYFGLGGGLQSNNSTTSMSTMENYAIELEVKKTYPSQQKSDDNKSDKDNKDNCNGKGNNKENKEKPIFSSIQQQSLGLSSGYNSNSFSSLISPSSPAKYSITPIINNCELQFPIHGGKSNIHQIEGLILLLEFLVRFVDSLDINIFNSVFNISKYYLGHINQNIRLNASSLIKTLIINHNENHEINMLFIIHSLAAEWPIRGPLCSTNATTEDNIPWEWKEGRLYVFEQLFKFLNNQQLHFITPTILKNSDGVNVRPGSSMKDRVLSLSKTNLKHLDTSIDSDLDSSSSQVNLGKNTTTQSLDQLINIELLKNYDSLVSNSINLHQKMPISHEYNKDNNIKILENLDISSSNLYSSHLHHKHHHNSSDASNQRSNNNNNSFNNNTSNGSSNTINTNNNNNSNSNSNNNNFSLYSKIRQRIPPHTPVMPNSPQVSSQSSKLQFSTQKYHTIHYGSTQLNNIMNNGNNLSMRYKLQSIVRSANTKLNEPMYLKKNISEFSNLQFHQQIMKILTFIFIQSTFDSYNNKQGELKFISKHLIPIITEALLWVDVETSVQLIRDIINGFVDPRSTIIDKSSDDQKYVLGLVLKALVVKAITFIDLNQKRKDSSNNENDTISYGSSGAIFGASNYDNSSSSNTNDNSEWAYIEKIIDQIKNAIPDIVNFISFFLLCILK
ncbi:hypothetical protein BCR32DRAFT_285425 [Anaeromyces robustus]|uniref:Uncharacterized protein n=1 Tax=Anaeromyces robustus TaxID=1754192 RepID=A0A1Y1WP68_9FUNG|nr:hypothetical protein BCR32DRAFT_285425 [Anaeromyces robustus]|eukprot:ORX75175.1 hypothetical protein BCR32DRAFT_285425 [Anaeromyces robustus]